MWIVDSDHARPLRGPWRSLLWVLAALALLSGCQESYAGGGHAHGAHGGHSDHGHGHAARGPSHDRLLFGEKTELHAKFPALVAGSAVDVHASITLLKGYLPATQGTVRVVLTSQDSPGETWEATALDSNAYKATITPKYPGKRKLLILFESAQLEERFDLGEVEVAAKPADATGGEDPGGEISLAKEQQWKLGFMTSVVAPSKVRASLPTTAIIHSPPLASVDIVAPTPGRFTAIEGTTRGRFSSVGQAVKQDQLLGMFTPDTPGSASVEIRSPTTGTIAQRPAEQGAVRAGEVLFTVIDRSKFQLEARVPEANLSKLGTPGGFWFTSPSEEGGVIEVNASTKDNLLSIGREIDPVTRQLPFLFSLDSVALPPSLVAGSTLRVHLFTGAARDALTIPASAVLDEKGVDTVFVMRGGESFERRVVKLGIRDRGVVEVLDGLKEGERVVSEGAYYVKLAGTSTGSVGHGHVH